MGRFGSFGLNWVWTCRDNVDGACFGILGQFGWFPVVG